MKRIGYLVLCFCAAARAVVRSPRRPPRLAAATARPPKPGLMRILIHRSVCLAVDSVLLGTAAVLLALRFAPKRSSLATSPLLTSGADRREDGGVQEHEDLAVEASDPDLQPLDMPNEEQVTPIRYTEEPAAVELHYPNLPTGAESVLPGRSIFTPGSASSSRFSALREVLFANGLPDLQRIGRRAEMADYRDPQHLYMDLDLDQAPDEPAAPSLPGEEPQAAPSTASALSDPSEEAAVLPPFGAPLPFMPLFRPARHEQQLHRSRLERGESLDGIQILPSRPGQYRRKS